VSSGITCIAIIGDAKLCIVLVVSVYR